MARKWHREKARRGRRFLRRWAPEIEMTKAMLWERLFVEPLVGPLGSDTSFTGLRDLL